MPAIKHTFSGFSVKNIDEARRFYEGTLGIETRVDKMGMYLILPNNEVFVYQKDDHTPATFTVLNLVVDDIQLAVDELRSKEVSFEIYPEMTEESGIAWGKKFDMGPNIAWFKDPSGNILSVLEN